ncbi:MAG: glycerophosphodiester phosphodiesterase family protein [Acholeplasma sp.]|nr:glycerophosphodiester phosphodiesterase family protein [Acholeplasma sp.]
MLKKIIVVSNKSDSDIKWLDSFDESVILNGLNAVEINSVKDAKKLGRILYKHQLFDIFIFSRSKLCLRTIHKIYPYARLVYMPDTFNGLPDLSKQTLSNHSNAVCLKAQGVTSQMVRRLKMYGLTVFVKVEKSIDSYQAVLSGVDGIVGPNISKKDIFLKGDFAFTPFVIAHRGLHKDTQENSVLAARKAIEAHADFIELDFHMTKDRHIVVNHDETLGRTYQKDYVIRRDTLKSLQTVKMTYKGVVMEETIQTIRSFHNQINDSDVQLLLESKTSSGKAIRRLRNAIKDMDKPPLLMSFYPFALVNFKKYAKEFSRGFIIDLNSSQMSIPDIIKIANKYNLVFHPYHIHKKQNLVEILKKRGIMYCPWGISSDHDLKYAFLSGYYGINTDESDRFKDIVKYFNVQTKHTYHIGDVLEIEGVSDKMTRIKGAIEILFDNPTGLVVSDNQIIGATHEGTAHVYVTYHVKTELVEYTLVSDLMTIEVVG